MNSSTSSLDKNRDRMRAYAVIALLALSWMLATSAEAQGLLDACDFIRHNPNLADCVYDTGRDICRLLIFITTIIAIAYPFFMPKKAQLHHSLRCWLAMASLPILIHLALTLFTNIFYEMDGFNSAPLPAPGYQLLTNPQ